MNTILFVMVVIALGCVGGGIQGLLASEGHWWWRYIAVASEDKRSRTEGKTYVMQPDDVVEFRFNV